MFDHMLKFDLPGPESNRTWGITDIFFIAC